MRRNRRAGILRLLGGKLVADAVPLVEVRDGLFRIDATTKETDESSAFL